MLLRLGRHDLPYARLGRVPGLDWGGEAHAEEPEGGGVACADGGDEGAGGEAEGGEVVEDDAAEPGCLADCGVWRGENEPALGWVGREEKGWDSGG